MEKLAQRSSVHLPFIGLILLALILGILLAPHYGEAWDDEDLRNYGEKSVGLYWNALHGTLQADESLRDHGSVFPTLAQMGIDLQAVIWPRIASLTTWHFFIFISFLLGLCALYAISIQLFSKPVALAVCLLFLSQPVLWGHGFINGKDTPLMSFFLLSLALGLRLEKLLPQPTWNLRGLKDKWRAKWESLNIRIRRRIKVQATVFLAFALTMRVISFFWQTLLRSGIQAAAASGEETMAGTLFAYFAPNFTEQSLDGYVIKAVSYLTWSLLLLMAIWLLAILYFAQKAMQASKSGAAAFSLWKGTSKYWKSPLLWAAAFAVGIATAQRIVSPFAAFLVFTFLIVSRGPNALRIMIPYVVIAAISTYIFWPYLWANPIANIFQAMNLASAFPWKGQLLFNGQLFRGTELPAGYLPTLLGIQLTVPTLALILVGLLMGLKRIAGKQSAYITAILFWFFFPLIYIIATSPVLYDNFRHLLFILPPLFILAGFALQRLSESLRPILFWPVTVIALLPGLIAILQLHPYEYVYYNEIIGGLSGASGHFELDYWGTALSEATKQINNGAKPGSRIVVYGPLHLVQNSARSDLIVQGSNNASASLDSADYEIFQLRAGRFFATYSDNSCSTTIGRLGVPFVIIKQPKCDLLLGE